MRKIENGSDIESLRKAAGLIQAEMANRMALGLRAYVSLEQDPTSVNQRHIQLAERVALRLAIERSDAKLIPANVADEIQAAAKLLRSSRG